MNLDSVIFPQQNLTEFHGLGISYGVAGCVNKTWGQYNDILRLPHIVVKSLTILPNHKISNQKHFTRKEKWYILSGTGQAVLEAGNSILSIDLKPGVKFSVAKETWHQVKADETSTLVVLEIQEGEDCREDDIERKDDVL